MSNCSLKFWPQNFEKCGVARSCEKYNKHMIKTGMITGIKLDPESKPEFCKLSAKSKSNCQPFPKESTTCATKYGERVHWDLWGPVAVQSLTGHSYVVAWMDDMT